MKKLLFRLLIAFLAVGIVTACSNESSGDSASESDNGAETENGSNDADGGEAESDGDRPTVQYFTDEHPSWPWRDDMLVWDLMEDGGNMNIEYSVGPSPYDEQLNLVIASGDLPDFFSVPSYQLANQHGDDGAFVNLLDYMDQMPNLQAWSEEYPENFRAALSADGKMYATPGEGMGETNRMIWMYRQDVFEELGLEPPKDWEELHQVLTALKEEYPDSYPLGFRNGTDKIRNFAANFGVEWNYYYDFDNEEWRYGPIEDNYRALIEHLHTFYQEGLISPDFLTTDTGQWQELMSTDTSFITQDYIGRIDQFNTANQADNPDYALRYMPPPAGFPGGEQRGYSAHTQYRGYAIASTSDNIDTLVQYIDWTFSEEGRDTLSWGIEGETYEEVDGEKQWIEDYADPSDLRSETGMSLYATYTWFDYDAHMSLFSENVSEAYEQDPQYDAPIVPVPAFTAQEQEMMSIQGEEITAHRDQEIAKFIIGDRDLSEWDAYVQEIENLGVQDLIDMHTEAYNRMLEVEIN